MGLENFKNYLKVFESSNEAEIAQWIDTVLASAMKKNKIDDNEVEHIIDYLVSSDAPTRLRKMSYKQAFINAKKWTEKNQKISSEIEELAEDTEMLMQFDNGYKIVKLLTKKAYQKEGAEMGHCLGGYDVSDNIDIYSLRDTKNKPHATFEVSKNQDTINQVKGKGNGNIHPNYINYALAFCEKIDRPIRKSEMKHLGYYYIDDCHIDFIKKTFPDEKILNIKESHYVR